MCRFGRGKHMGMGRPVSTVNVGRLKKLIYRHYSGNQLYAIRNGVDKDESAIALFALCAKVTIPTVYSVFNKGRCYESTREKL